MPLLRNQFARPGRHVQFVNGKTVLSASDIVRHLGCEHLTALNLLHLAEPQTPTAPDDQALLLARKGNDWERQYLAKLRADHADLTEIDGALDVPTAVAATLAAMQAGVSHIFQAALTAPGFYGRADFLRRVPGASALGDFHYEVLDTKLARKPKASHVIQLCFYSWLLEEAQGLAPRHMHIVHGDGSLSTHRYAAYSRYFHRLRQRTVLAVEQPRGDTYPDPCEQCETCRWQARCDEQRRVDDHLWQVAGITRTQIRRLQDAGIRTMHGLAAVPPTAHVPKMAPDTLTRSRTQAAMQCRGLEAGSPCFDLKPDEPDRGFRRLPRPSEGDLYFDMEGDPLHEDNGLEYLFGVSWREDGAVRFRAFWAHDRAAEKAAFEAFMDWVAERLVRWPELHIYHYAAYENTALKKLASLHATREEAVDELLRQRRLVDLYRVVTESLVASTDSYSIKKIESFYRNQARSGEVTNAGASVVWYERWRETQDPQLLADIERYNRDDCESTAELHAWLCKIRPPTLAWRTIGRDSPQDTPAPEEPRPLDDAAREREAVKARLLAAASQDTTAETIAWLLDFHRREAKPVWWKVFSCADLTPDELVDDIECIGGLRRVAIEPPVGRGRYPTWVYEYPEQEFKTSAGDKPTRADTHAAIELLEIDEDARSLTMAATYFSRDRPARARPTPART
jgi:predicted RecB family nuclease